MSEQQVSIPEVPEGWDEDRPDAFKQLRDHSSGLARDLAAERTARAEESAQLETYRKRDRFLESLGDIQGVSFEDVKDVPLEQITPTLLKVKADEKAASVDSEVESLAAKLGLEPQQFKTALSTLTSMQQQERQELASQTAAASATGGAPLAPSELTPSEAGTKAYQEAKAQGMAEDRAQAEYLRASRERQLELNAVAAEAR